MSWIDDAFVKLTAEITSDSSSEILETGEVKVWTELVTVDACYAREQTFPIGTDVDEATALCFTNLIRHIKKVSQYKPKNEKE